MKLQNPFSRPIVSLKRKKIKPGQKRLFRLGCAALALTLTVGTVPFLLSHAAEGETVTPSDIAAKCNVVSPADAPARRITRTAEPKQTLTDDSSTVHTYTRDGFTAAFDTATGVLTITGTGTLTQSFIGNIGNIGALYDVFGGANQPNVKKIIIDGEITEIGERAFEYFGGSTDGDTTVEVKGKVTKVNDFAFAWTADIDYVVFGSTVTQIGDEVFWQASAIKSVTFPKNVKIIGKTTWVFAFCSSLTDIYIESPSLESCSKMIRYNRVCNVHLPCEHFTIGGNDISYISEHKSDYFDNANVDIPQDNTELREYLDPTCTDNGYSGDEVCKGCGLVLDTGSPIEALGHDWDEGTVTTPANCAHQGVKTYVCRRDDRHIDTRAIDIDPDAHDWGEWTGDPVQTSICKNDENHKQYRLNPDIRFAATFGNNSQYTLGSKKTLGLTIDRVDRKDENVFSYIFINRDISGEIYDDTVKVTGSNDYSKTLTADDFDAENGSLKITLKAAYLEGLAPGTYSLTASFKVADGFDPIVSEPVSFTIVKPSGGSSSPATGESGNMTTFCVALMLIAAYGAVYALTRRKTENAG